MKNIAIHTNLLNKDEAADLITKRNKDEKVGNIHIHDYDFVKFAQLKTRPYVMEYVKGTPFENKVYASDFIELIMQDEANNEKLHYDDHIELEEGKLRIAPIVCLLYLNNMDEDFFGGQLYFPFQKAIVEPKIGTLAIFPTGHFYPHKVLPFTGGKRYLLKMFYYIDSGLNEQDRDYLVRQIKGEHYGYEN